MKNYWLNMFKECEIVNHDCNNCIFERYGCCPKIKENNMNKFEKFIFMFKTIKNQADELIKKWRKNGNKKY